MKKLNFIVLASILSFVSCDIKQEIENLIEENAEVNETIEEDFEVPVIETIGEQEPIIIPVDTTELTDAIEEEGGDFASLDSASIEDIQIAIPEGSDATFNFLESASVVISSGEFAGTVLATIDTIPENATILDLTPTDEAANLVELLESGNFDLEVNFVADETLAEPLQIELISEFLVGFDIEL